MFDLIIDTEVRGGPTESPLVKAKNLANAELRQQATAEEQAWLSANPALWLRALTWFSVEVKLHIGNQRVSIKTMTERPELVEKRRNAQERLLASQHFLKLCEERLAEVAVLAGPDQMGTLTGDVLAMALRAAALLRSGWPADAEGVLNALIVKLGRYAELGPPPDNATAAPIKVIVHGLKASTRLNCRACGRGKVNPHDPGPRCSMCQQRHLIES